MDNTGAIYDQMLLRNKPEFRDFIHAAILQVADTIMKEPTTTPFNTARVAMAKKLIETNEKVASDFVTRILFRAIMVPVIRNSVVTNGQVILSIAKEDILLQGIADLWNETTLAVWPTVLTDVV